MWTLSWYMQWQQLVLGCLLLPLARKSKWMANKSTFKNVKKDDIEMKSSLGVSTLPPPPPPPPPPSLPRHLRNALVLLEGAYADMYSFFFLLLFLPSSLPSTAAWTGPPSEIQRCCWQGRRRIDQNWHPVERETEAASSRPPTTTTPTTTHRAPRIRCARLATAAVRI